MFHELLSCNFNLSKQVIRTKLSIIKNLNSSKFLKSQEKNHTEIFMLLNRTQENKNLIFYKGFLLCNFLFLSFFHPPYTVSSFFRLQKKYSSDSTLYTHRKKQKHEKNHLIDFQGMKRKKRKKIGVV